MKIHCKKCGTPHEEGSRTYITIEGNIYVGENGGIIGNNFPLPLPEDTKARKFTIDEVNRTHFCVSCFIEEFLSLQRELIREAEAGYAHEIKTLRGGT